MLPDPRLTADPADLIPSPEVILPRLAQASRDVQLLRGLLRLSRRRAERPAGPPPLRPFSPAPKRI